MMDYIAICYEQATFLNNMIPWGALLDPSVIERDYEGNISLNNDGIKQELVFQMWIINKVHRMNYDYLMERYTGGPNEKKKPDSK